MNNSWVRIVAGTVMLAGATAGALGAPQPSALFSRFAGTVSPAVHFSLLAGLLGLVAARRMGVLGGYSGRHRG